MTKPSDLELDRAIAATRRHFDGRPERNALTEKRSALTEQRILEAAWPARRRFRPLLYLPLAALFVGSVAFAQELGTLLDGARARFSSVFEQHDPAASAPSPQLPKSARVAPASVVRAPSPSPSPSASASASASPPPSVRAAARVTAPARTPSYIAPAASADATSVAATPADPDPAEATVDEIALYREAHQAHFVEHDYAAALTRWDRYLAAARHGSLVPEARYNRALALYHLGRRAEARAALRPFANGAYGRYRRDEASRLLESLEAPAR